MKYSLHIIYESLQSDHINWVVTWIRNIFIILRVNYAQNIQLLSFKSLIFIISHNILPWNMILSTSEQQQHPIKFVFVCTYCEEGVREKNTLKIQPRNSFITHIQKKKPRTTVLHLTERAWEIFLYFHVIAHKKKFIFFMKKKFPCTSFFP